MRCPRMHGRPPHTAGSTEMRSRRSGMVEMIPRAGPRGVTVALRESANAGPLGRLPVLATTPGPLERQPGMGWLSSSQGTGPLVCPLAQDAGATSGPRRLRSTEDESLDVAAHRVAEGRAERAAVGDHVGGAIACLATATVGVGLGVEFEPVGEGRQGKRGSTSTARIQSGRPTKRRPKGSPQVGTARPAVHRPSRAV
jgi:hypothetical protein